MTDRHPHLDDALDDLARHALDDEAVQTITDRVARRLADETGSALRGCRDIQALLPDLVAGSLSPARSLLVEDHTRHCVPCRRALMEARSPAAPPTRTAGSPARASSPRWRLLRRAAMLVALLAGGVLAYSLVTDRLAERSLVADLQQGDVYLLEDGGVRALTAGDQVAARRTIRTGRRDGAHLRLPDGSLIEAAPRTQLELRASGRGTTIGLDRGSVIVHAARQDSGRLFVDTGDCLVAVKGTIFSVNHGLKGSRVSVIEGEVEVRQGRAEALLRPGEQLTTDPRLGGVPVAEEIAWSRDAEQYRRLLRELAELQRDMSDALETASRRYRTRLLDLAPADTVVYLAIPNLTEGVDAARQVLADRVAASPVLDQWWQANVVERGVDRLIDDVIDRLRPLGQALGDEIVVALTETGLAGDAGPVVLAVVEDAPGFRAALDRELERLGDASAIAWVEDPERAPADSELLLWLGDGVVVAATDPSPLQAVARQVTAGGEPPLAGTPLHARLAEAYDSGVAWLAGVDLQTLFKATSDGRNQVLDRLGILGARTLVVQRSRDGERASVQAEVDFDGPRQGVASWLAAPSPMGSLDFISPQASLVTAVTAKDAVEMFDDLMSTLAATDPAALRELESLQREVGLDLRGELAVALGGEGAFAVDGPVLPMPAWKLVVEVYQPELLQATVEKVVREANRRLAAGGAPGILLQQVATDGHATYELILAGGAYRVAYTFSDGFLVATPGVELLRQALQNQRAGLSLSASAAFRELLPANAYMGCSALLYRNLGELAEALPKGTMDALPPTAGELLRSGTEPSLLCLCGEEQRIVIAGSGGSVLPVMPLLGASSLGPLVAPSPSGQGDGVSSGG